MDAEDAAQEVMISLWENMGKFKIASAGSYIMKITHNKCIDHLRKRKNINNKETGMDEYFIETYEDKRNENNPMTIAHSNIVSERIKNCIHSLPENLKGVFIMYEIHGMKYRDISKTLDIPINSVKVYLFRARKQLQEILKKHELQEA